MKSEEKQLERIKREFSPLNAATDAIWLIKQAEKAEEYLEALRDIETHIRATPEPIPHIMDTLKKTLPEFN